MKKISKMFLFLFMFVIFSSPAFALFNEKDNVKMYTQEEMKTLTDDQLKEAVEDTAIEIHAQEVFHGRAGFTNPKEYANYKSLLKMFIKLKEEMQRRELKLPPIEDLTTRQGF